MYKMQTVYPLENLANPDGPLTFGVYTGLCVKAELSVDPSSGIPSDFTVLLSNTDNSVSFNWNAARASVSASTMDYTIPASPVKRGSSKNFAVSHPYNTAYVLLSVQGPQVYARVKYGTSSYEVKYRLYSDSSSYVSGWRVRITSNTLGSPCGTVFKNYSVISDGAGTGSVQIEHIVLSAQDILNSYVTLPGPPPTGMQVNLAQSTTLQLGVDYIVVGNRIMWHGLGLDLPSLQPGMTLRLMYSAMEYGEANVSRVGKRLTSLRRGGL